MQPSLPPMPELEAEFEDFALKTNMLAEAVTQFKGVWRGKIGKGDLISRNGSLGQGWAQQRPPPRVGKVWLEGPSIANAPLT